MRRPSTPRHATSGQQRAARRAAAEGVQLAWALDREGRKVAAAALDERTRRERAPFRCAGCGDPLVPHLGRVRARHFAHEPGSACPLTAPETALHLNAKERLLFLCAEAFSGRGRVLLRARCPGCLRPMPLDLAEVGDEARDEERLGALRPDILLLASGRPVLALEVLVTHAVDEKKEAALAVLGVPAAEIDAREEWEELVGGAIEIVPDRGFGFARCGACDATARADADRGKGGEAAEVAELEAYRARGLLGPRPVATPAPALRAGGEPQAERLTPADRLDLSRRFRCPECGEATLAFGDRLARHACPGAEPRPVAWRGYDGSLVELRWWHG
ncbi:MAG TPA: competence protein CoiA family protein [Anaeromyxobacteraceae bacterium]|nr:competence protein CoiA family protein [Anaeromyxobacteraceae bacterium]